MADPTIKIKMSVEMQEAAEEVANFVKKTQESLESAYTTSVERAKKSLDDLVRKHQQVQATIDADKQKIDELTRKREDAGKEAAKLIDQEIEGLKRIVAGREIEKLKIEEKKVKLEEVGRLALATSDAEKEAIREATNARVAEISALRDQERAQSSLNATVEEGSAGLGTYFSRFLGVGAAITATQQLLQAWQTTRDEIGRTGEAMAKLQSLSQGQHDKFKPVFNEFGLYTQEEQDAAQASLNQNAAQYKITQAEAVSVAARLAPAAKAAGMTGVNDPRFQSLVGNVGLYASRGFDANATGDYVADLLHDNKNLTGEEASQKLANLQSAMGGSPRRASGVLSALQEERGILKTSGLNDDDFIKANVAMMNNGVPEDEAKTLSRQLFQSLNRLKGLSRSQLADEHRQMQDYTKYGEQALQMYGKFFNPNQMLSVQEGLRSGGIPELDKYFDDAMTTGHLDINAFSSAVSGLSGEKLARAARVFGGPRNVVGMGQAAGFGSVVLPSNAPTLPVASSPGDISQVAKEQAQATVAQANAIAPNQSAFEELERHSQEGIDLNRNRDFGFFDRTFGRVLTMGITANDKEKSYANVVGNELVRTARALQAIDAGKVKATPEQRAQLQNASVRLLQRLQSDPTHPDNDAWVKFSALAYGKADYINQEGYTRDQILNQMQTPEAQQKFVRSELPYSELPGNIDDIQATLPVFNEAEQSIDSLRPKVAPPQPASKQGEYLPSRKGGVKPTTQPAQHSVNYNIRQYNYGYTPGSMASPESYPSRMG